MRINEIVSALERAGEWLDQESVEALEVGVLGACGCAAVDAGVVPGWNAEVLRLELGRSPWLVDRVVAVLLGWGVVA